MTTSTESIVSAQRTPRLLDFRTRIFMLIGSLLAVVVAYQESLFSMVKIWNDSETFAHGFLIFPISLYIVYENRWRFSNKRFVTSWPAIPLIFATGLFWWLAKTAEIQVLHQFAFVALIPLTVLFYLGWATTKEILFPLLFLFLSVPFGADLIPIMIDFTADFVVFAIRVVGIPVYREGTFFILPSGSWSVVSGCSGMRYLMATITVGLLFAYMNYHSISKRVVFMIAACIVALVANWLRAFGIVMIAHYSGMKLALGVDHYIYGWVFFGIIVFALMTIGRLWQEDPLPESINAKLETNTISSAPLSILLVLTLISVLIAWPAYFNYSKHNLSRNTFDIPTVNHANGWRLVPGEISSWQPKYAGHTELISNIFEEDQRSVGTFLAWYPMQSRDAEVINARNILVDEKHKIWRHFAHEDIPLTASTGPKGVIESSLKSPDQRLLIWRWYWIAGHHTTNTYLAKAYEVLGSLTGRGNGGGELILYTEVSEVDTDFKEARALLKDFISDYRHPLNDALNTTIP